MRSAKSTGRIVGILLLVQLVGLTVAFISLLPITTPDFLENAARVSFKIRAAVLLLFANGALTIGMSIAAFTVLRQYSYKMSLWLLAFSVIWFSLQAIDNVHILSMLSLSQQYAQGGTSNAELLAALATALRSTRTWAHATELLVIDSWFFIFYGLLFRSAVVPRALAGFALIIVLVHTTAIGLPVFVRYSRVLVLAYSLALSYLAVSIWLVVKGFEERYNTNEGIA